MNKKIDKLEIVINPATVKKMKIRCVVSHEKYNVSVSKGDTCTITGNVCPKYAWGAFYDTIETSIIGEYGYNICYTKLQIEKYFEEVCE